MSGKGLVKLYCRADERRGNMCVNGWGGQVDEWKMAVVGPGKLGHFDHVSGQICLL